MTGFVMGFTKRGRWAGNGYIAGVMPGIATVNSVPAAREVEVRHRRTRQVVATTFSAVDGTYRVPGLDPSEQFDAIGRDWRSVYNDVIVSRITPAAGIGV